MTDSVDDLLAAFRRINETIITQHIWEDGAYQGCIVIYANPVHTMFHPYIPLTVFGEPSPRLTRDYFIKHGLSIPGE